MVARTREVIWAESARDALGEVLEDIAKDSPAGAVRVLERALEAAASLAELAERGRIVPEVGDAALPELFVFDYRLLYRVDRERVVIRAFLHGARDFAGWQRDRAAEL